MRVIQTILAIIVISYSIAFAQDAPPAKVVVTKIVQEEVAENQSFIGLLYYDRVSRVSTEVPGLVEIVEVREGDRVKKGDPLVRLDTKILDKEIALSRTRVAQIKLRSQHEEKNYKRLERLFSEEGISEKGYDDALYDYEDTLKEKQAAEQGLEKLLIQKQKSVVEAPFDGIVLEKSVESGNWVQQGNQLVRLGSTNDLFVKVPVAETILQFVSVGDEVPVEINAFKKTMTGIISEVGPVADAKTKNIFLKVRIPSLPNVSENMSATVFVSTSAKRKLSIIPRDALIKFQGKDFVYTVKEGKAAILPVNIVTYSGAKIGADNPYFTPGMPVVVEGNERLRPDQPVTVAGEK